MTAPVGRPIASSQIPTPSLAGGRSGQVTATDDSASPRRSRVSAGQLHDLAGRLSDPDKAALELVGGLRLCSGEQLTRALWWEGTTKATRERRARRALLRLTAWRVLERLPRRVGGVRAGSRGFLYGVGPAGARLLARDDRRPRRLVTPGDRFVEHTLAVAELVVELMEAERAGRLELVDRPETEPTCWRRFPGPLGGRLTLKPDLFTRLAVGALEDRWFVEIDRATESPATITRKARVYLAHYRSGAEQTAHGVYPRVLWSVPDARRAAVVTEALPAGAARLFVVCTHAEAVGRLAEEARS